MTARRAAASIIVIAAVAALAGCSDPEPTDKDYLATHIGFWTVATRVAQEETGKAPRDDLTSTLTAQWNDPSEQARWRAVYDGVCDELEKGGEPDLIADLAQQLEKQDIGQDAARKGVMEQVDVIVEHLCPSQAGRADEVRKELVKG